MSDQRAEAIARFAARPCPVRLEPVIQPYAWGGDEFLAELVGLTPTPGRPRAELWAGAHPGGPAVVHLDEDVRVRLDELIERAAPAVLGEASIARFGPQLPYLLKVLDVRAMLSIQAHPNIEQAAAGFARENAAGVPLSAPHRNYRDANHKPEAQVALTDFWLLYGFRPVAEIERLADERQELDVLRPAFAGRASEYERLRILYLTLMSLPQAEVDAAVDAIVGRASALADEGRLEPSSHEYWAARAAREFALPGGHHDRGILLIHLLNLVHLAPGQATFIGPGVLHAYLSGVAVEIMASSDNVLRGGLTPKHVDVLELQNVLTFRSDVPRVVDGTPLSALEREYRGWADEFVLTRARLDAGQAVRRRSASAEVLLVLDGQAGIGAGTETLPLGRGQLALVPAGLDYSVAGGADTATVFRAAVPI